MDQLPRLGKRELICLLSFTCNYVVFVWRGFLFLGVLGMGYVILLWHSLSLPYNYFETTCTQPSATSNISTEPDLFYTTLSEHSYSSKEDTQPEENQDDGTLQDSTCPEEEDVEQIYYCDTVCPGLGKLKRTGYLSTFRYFYRCKQLTSGTSWRHLIELEI